ncbi:MAG: hypothetical protein ACTS6J_23085 [Burkholderiales bacterium]
MPTLDWLNRLQAMRVADAVPCRMIEPAASRGGRQGIFLSRATFSKRWVCSSDKNQHCAGQSP